MLGSDQVRLALVETIHRHLAEAQLTDEHVIFATTFAELIDVRVVLGNVGDELVIEARSVNELVEFYLGDHKVFDRIAVGLVKRVRAIMSG